MITPEIVSDASGSKDPFKLEVARTDQEAAALRRKVVTIARVFSSNAKMKVYSTATDYEPWSCGLGPDGEKYYQEFMSGERESLLDVPEDTFRPKVINYSRNSLKTDTLTEVLGVLRHELGHANNTDFRLMFEGQKFASEQGYLPLSWANLMNALEDTWVNNEEMKKSDTIREQMEARYDARLGQLEELTPKLPVNLQLGKNILYYWVTGKNMPTITDQRVLETFENIRPYIDQFAHGASAQENFELVKEKIWPKYQKLEEMAQKDAEKQQMLNALGQQQGGQKAGGEGQAAPGQGEGSGQGSQGSQEGEGAGSEGGLMGRMRRMMGGGKQGNEKGKDSKREQGDTEEKKAARQLSEQIKQMTPSEIQQLLSEAIEQIQSSDPNNREVKANELPPDAQQALEQAMANLPPEIQQELAEQAKRRIEEAIKNEVEEENHMNFTKIQRNEKTGRMEMALNTTSQKEQQRMEREMEKLEREEALVEAQEAEQAAAEEAAREQALKEIQERQKLVREMKRAGFEENEEEAFRMFRGYENGIKPYVRSFIDRILPSLPKREETFFEGLYPTGKRLDTKALAKKIPINDARVLMRKDIKSSEEARIYVQLLIDNSGSMSGQKMEESVKTGIFFARVLQTLNVPFAIKLFGSGTFDLKKLEEEYDDPKFRIKPKLVFETTASESSTDIGTPLQQAQTEMLDARRKFPESQGMIFLITDGQANQGLTGTALSETAHEIAKKFPIFVFGLGGGEGLKSYLEQTYGEGRVVMPETFNHLPTEAGRVLLVQMHRLLRRLQI